MKNKVKNKSNINALIIFVIGLCFCALVYVNCQPVRFEETRVSNVLEVKGFKYYLSLRGETINGAGGDGPFEAEMWININKDEKNIQVRIYSNNETSEERVREKIENHYVLKTGSSLKAIRVYYRGKHLGIWDIDKRQYEGNLSLDPN